MSTTLTELQSIIRNLPDRDQAEFSQWYDDFINNLWDEKMKRDADEGRLDFLGEQIAAAREQNTLRAFP
jgi:hypothetical protein